LFDETTAHNSESNSAVVTEEPTTEQLHQPELNQAAASTDHTTETHADSAGDSAGDDKTAVAEDFASVLENFTTEAEEAVSEDRVIKGTVLKLTATHVVVDVGAKSEGMLPLAEVLDHEGNPKFQPGDAIDVMREKGHTEEGYINLSHQKAQRCTPGTRSKKLYNDKASDQCRRCRPHQGRSDRGYSRRARVSCLARRLTLRPIRNLDALKGQDAGSPRSSS
jgi:small subunit ribosomal protein S1